MWIRIFTCGSNTFGFALIWPLAVNCLGVYNVKCLYGYLSNSDKWVILYVFVMWINYVTWRRPPEEIQYEWQWTSELCWVVLLAAAAASVCELLALRVVSFMNTLLRTCLRVQCAYLVAIHWPTDQSFDVKHFVFRFVWGGCCLFLCLRLHCANCRSCTRSNCRLWTGSNCRSLKTKINMI